MKKLLAILLLLISAPALALGPYPGDQFTIDEQGNALAALTVTVYHAGTTDVATIYSDNGTTQIVNPMTTDYRGHFMFWAANGSYDICYTGAGIEPWCDLAVKILDTEHVGLPSFNVTDARFGAKGDNITDDTAAIQAAIDAAGALASKAEVVFPNGKFKVTSTIDISNVPLIGQGFNSELVSYITDGSPVLRNDGVADRVHIENLSIVNNDPNTVGNFTGVYLDSNRGYMSNVRVRRAAVGFYIEGWIHDFVNLWAYYCTTGFSGVTLNSARVNINTETCTTGMTLESGGAIQLTGVCEAHSVGLLVDGVNGLDACVWFEGNDSLDVIAGATTLCKDLVFTGSFRSGTFDNVNGLDLAGVHVAGSGPVYVTDNAANVRGLPAPVAGTYDGDYSLPRSVRSESGFSGPENYFPDPYFVHGFEAVSDTTGSAREALSIDTTHEIGGGGLRVTSTDGVTLGSTYSHVVLPASVAASLAGKVARLGAWVYIPDDDANYPASGSDIHPDITVSWYDGSWHENGTASQTWTNDGWTFFSGLYPIGSAATGIRVGFYQSRNGSYAPPAGTYVTFSGVFLGEEDATVSDISLGKWTRHEYASAASEGVYDAWKYGARPNDGADDTAAIQAAIDAAERNGGGIVTLPPGQFRLTGAGLTIADHGVILRGATRGYEADTDRGTILAPLSAMSAPMLTISSGGVFSIYRSGVIGITFRSGGAYYSDGLVSLINCRDCVVRDCVLYMNDSEADDNTALQIISTSSLASTGNRVDGCYIHSTHYIPGPTNGTGYGLTIHNAGGTYNTANYITDTKFYDPSQVGNGALWVWEAGADVGANMFANCHFGATTNGTNKGLLLEGAGGGTTLVNCIIDGEAADTLLTFGDLGSGAAPCYYQGSIDGVWVDLNDSSDDYATVIDNGDDGQFNTRAFRLLPRSAAPAAPVEGTLYYDSDTDDVMVYTSLGWEILFDGAD